jgi:hypothetical protein
LIGRGCCAVPDAGEQDADFVVTGESGERRKCEGATGSLAIIAPDDGPSHMAPRGAASMEELGPA